MGGCDHIIVFSVCCVVSDIDECASHPCQHEGTCADHVARYTCTCASGYGGASCQTGRSLFCIKYETNSVVLTVYILPVYRSVKSPGSAGYICSFHHGQKAP